MRTRGGGTERYGAVRQVGRKAARRDAAHARAVVIAGAADGQCRRGGRERERKRERERGGKRHVASVCGSCRSSSESIVAAAASRVGDGETAALCALTPSTCALVREGVQPSRAARRRTRRSSFPRRQCRRLDAMFTARRTRRPAAHAPTTAARPPAHTARARGLTTSRRASAPAAPTPTTLPSRSHRRPPGRLRRQRRRLLRRTPRRPAVSRSCRPRRRRRRRRCYRRRRCRCD